MKKVLVATCVVAMTAFGITNASADPVSSARGNAFGIDVGGSLLEDLIEREPEVTSVLGDGLVSDDIITPDLDPIAIAGTGVVLANTSVESTIVPFTSDGGESLGGGGSGGGGGGDDDEGFLGGIFDDLLGEGEGGGDDGLVGGIAGLSEGDAGVVKAQQIGDLTGGGDDGGDDEGTLGGLLGGDLLGGLLDGGDEGDDVGSDDEIIIPAVNAQGLSRIEDLNLVVEDGDDDLLGDLPTEVSALLVDALLEIDAVTAEAVAVCVDNQIFFDTSSNIVSLNDEPVTLIDDLLDSVSDVTEDLGLIEIATNEQGVTDDGTGVFVNALRITLLDDLGLGGDDDGEGGDSFLGLSGGDAETVEAQQVGDDDDDNGDEPVLEIILGHAEVSGNVCAAQAAPPVVQDLPPSGDGPTLPVTGGGLGALPGVLALGLAGGAVAAGRLALRSRREHNL